MLEVTNSPALLPVTGPTPVDLDAFVSPEQNLVNGYNIAEQTCFHKTTVSNLIPSLKAISAAYKGLSALVQTRDRKSTRLNSSHVSISYTVFCLKKKNINK